MTNPTRQEILDAHKTLEYLIKNLYDISLEEAKHTTSYKRLAKFLPPKPLLTMNDIKWTTMSTSSQKQRTALGEK